MQNYPHLLTWYAMVPGNPTNAGTREDTYPIATGSIWGEITETNGRRNEDFGPKHTGQDATIIVRNRPNIRPQDKLTHNGRTWIVDTMKRLEPDDLELRVYSFDGVTL